MPALWTYPWTLEREGLDATADRLAACGIDTVNVASHYHSVRSMSPRSPDALFHSASGSCYFDPGEAFDGLAINPPVNAVGEWADPLEAIAEGLDEYGIATNAWTVCLHNTRLASANPDHRIESAFGDAHDHSLCPSHPEVRAYFASVVRAARERGVSGIHLESVGFPSAFHDHGADFGHPKRQTIASTAGEILLSQCFCDGCRAAAEAHPIDLEAAGERVHELLADPLADPTASPPPLEDLVADDPLVADLFEFRAAVIEDLLADLDDAAGSIPLTYYVMEAAGADPDQLLGTGVRFDALEEHVDRLLAICYVADPDVARERIGAIDAGTRLPTDAGITLDPTVIGSEDEFRELANAVREEAEGVSIYHDTLATETHLEWLESAFA
ncbi:hypothetical protein [Saliphagus sp. LR7]|uniref:hypothetical protein n=1 Tax=Saliphagus sp. LR7 TaxID=2282654 RepID=UPI000DF7B4E8|nr:hypothetical protein [Saliphagus sp. LR7]